MNELLNFSFTHQVFIKDPSKEAFGDGEIHYFISHKMKILFQLHIRTPTSSMKEIIYISLFIVVPAFLICLLHCFWLCYIYYKRRPKLLIDLPPSYSEIVLSEKQLPKYPI